jgi:hypothetical protein
MPTASRSFPRLIHPHRWCSNGRTPDQFYPKQIAMAVNHGMAYRRKMIASAAMPVGQVSVSGTINYWRFRFRSGHGATRLTVDVLMGLADTGATDPYVLVGVTPSGGAETTEEAHYGATSAGGTTDVPYSLSDQSFHFDIDPQTTYEVRIAGVDYSRPVSFRAYEHASAEIDGSVDYYCALSPSVEYPIQDSDRARLIDAVSELWLENGTQLICWPGRGTSTAPSITSVTAATPGFHFGSESILGIESADLPDLGPLARLKDGGNLPVTLCAFAVATGVGTPTGELRLVSSGATIATLNITGTPGWHTTDVTWTSAASIAGGKVDVQIRGTAAGYTCAVTAFALYTRR